MHVHIQPGQQETSCSRITSMLGTGQLLSPDLNPIEHLWDEIQRRLNEELPGPTTAAELSVAFQRVWPLIPMAFINRLVNSMYRRCAAVINAGGGHTRY